MLSFVSESIEVPRPRRSAHECVINECGIVSRLKARTPDFFVCLFLYQFKTVSCMANSFLALTILSTRIIVHMTWLNVSGGLTALAHDKAKQGEPLQSCTINQIYINIMISAFVMSALQDKDIKTH